MYCERGPCPYSQPWSLRIAGPQPDEDRTSLSFTPQFPCGVESDPAFATFVPLQRIATWGGCLAPGLPPGTLVLLRGHVQALDSTQGPGPVEPLNIGECQGASAHPRVKLEIWPCGYSGSVLIDADSEIVVPAGECSINVLAPGGMTAAPAPVPVLGGWVRVDATRPVLGAPTLWTDVALKIVACPLSPCYCPEGVLTEWVRALIDTSPLGSAILMRPRRARRLEMSNRDNAGAVATITVEFLEDANAAVAAMSEVVFPTTPAVIHLLGSMQALLLPRIVAGVNTYVRWEIR